MMRRKNKRNEPGVMEKSKKGDGIIQGRRMLSMEYCTSYERFGRRSQRSIKLFFFFKYYIFDFISHFPLGKYEMKPIEKVDINMINGYDKTQT